MIFEHTDLFFSSSLLLSFSAEVDSGVFQTRFLKMIASPNAAPKMHRQKHPTNVAPAQRSIVASNWSGRGGGGGRGHDYDDHQKEDQHSEYEEAEFECTGGAYTQNQNHYVLHKVEKKRKASVIILECNSTTTTTIATRKGQGRTNYKGL